jgi:hypothetical protein
VSDRRVGWLESELERWGKARAAQRGAPTDSWVVEASRSCGHNYPAVFGW